MENSKPALGQKLQNNFLDDLNFLREFKVINSKYLEHIWLNFFACAFRLNETFPFFLPFH